MRPVTPPRRRTWRLITGLLVAGLSIGALASVAWGAGSPPSRDALTAASVRQAGRTLVWRVTLADRLTAHDLTGHPQRLCLLLGRGGELCVVPARHPDTSLGLSWSPIGGAAHAVGATVTRTSATGLAVSVLPAALGLPYRSLRWQARLLVAGPGCPASAATPGCASQLPGRPALVRLHAPRLVGCTTAGESIRYGGPADRREIALTFDDGPWSDPPTIDFVHELRRLHAVGTFFEIGDQISEYDPSGSVERAMLADGDMIGDHTWTHPDMLDLSPAAQTSQLQRTAVAIRHATGFTPCLWRPPYGAIDPALEGLARHLGFLSVYWNDDPRDWSLPGVSAIVRTVLDEARSGSIVEMHFGGGPRLQTLQALPTIVADLRARGYRFVNLVQMFGLRERWR